MTFHDTIKTLHQEGRFDSERYDAPNCKPGNKPCGRTCIPQRYNCRANKSPPKRVGQAGMRAVKAAGGVLGAAALVGGGAIALRHHNKIKSALTRVRKHQTEEIAREIEAEYQRIKAMPPEEVAEEDRRQILEEQEAMRERRTAEYKKREQEGVSAVNAKLKQLGLEQIPYEPSSIPPPLPERTKRKEKRSGIRRKRRRRK